LFHELEPYEQTRHEKIFLAHPRESNWENLGADLREAELAVRRYDTPKIQQMLLKLVPELAKSSSGNAPDEASAIVPLHRAR
ncbi:MAG TPA: polysaccharide biosynthesis protein, partial [Xanthomonadales bacterium]|nr:polysaccharide biosynthesis protein [Xanthomonadales bacterium]